MKNDAVVPKRSDENMDAFLGCVFDDYRPEHGGTDHFTAHQHFPLDYLTLQRLGIKPSLLSYTGLLRQGKT